MKALLIVLVFIVMLLPVSAVVFDNAGILDESITNQTIAFENETSIKLTLVTLVQTEDINQAADGYFNRTGSDLIMLYDLKNNRIAIARPLGKQPAISDQEISDVLGRRYAQKSIIKTGTDAAEYISDVIKDLEASILQKGPINATGTISACSIIKDGICDPNCYNDPDCKCGNGACDYDENYLTCPADCMIEDYTCMYISDNKCDTNCPVMDVDCPIDYNSPGYLNASVRMNALEIMLIAVLVVLIVTLVYIYMLTKR